MLFLEKYFFLNQRQLFFLQINTTNTGSTLNINKLKPEFSGEYLCRIENVAGAVESTASLTVMKPADRGLMPEFKQRINDVRSQQNASSQFSCVVAGTPEPTTSWFKVLFFNFSELEDEVVQWYFTEMDHRFNFYSPLTMVEMNWVGVANSFVLLSLSMYGSERFFGERFSLL